MPWALLITDLRVWLGAALIATGLYAAVQRLEKEAVKLELAEYKTKVAQEAAENRVRNAQEAARQAQTAQEALDALQIRYAALDARYRRLRSNAADRPAVPALASAAPLLGSCPGHDGEPDASPRFLAEVESRVTGILEEGDREIAKYVELWQLEVKRSTPKDRQDSGR